MNCSNQPRPPACVKRRLGTGLRLVVSAGETIVIATIVFGRTGDGYQSGDQQCEGSRGDGDDGPQGLPLLVLAITRRTGALNVPGERAPSTPSRLPKKTAAESPRRPKFKWFREGTA
jgi:hypothetical protein